MKLMGAFWYLRNNIPKKLNFNLPPYEVERLILSKRCDICGRRHRPEDCIWFRTQDIQRRYEILQLLNLCVKCLRLKHWGNCDFPYHDVECDHPGCKSRTHHRLLHYEDQVEKALEHFRNDEPVPTGTCSLCGRDHRWPKCQTFLSMTIDARRKVAKTFNMCELCLRPKLIHRHKTSCVLGKLEKAKFLCKVQD